MEIEIIPAVNAKTFAEVAEKIRLVEGHVSWVHLDVADGTFTKNSIWRNPADLKDLKTSLCIEVHVMINSIDERIQEWLIPQTHRVIFQIEAAKNPAAVIDLCHHAKKEAGIAISPETNIERVFPFIHSADLIQTLAVVPGTAGQAFQDHILKKISALRTQCPSCVIEADGGITPENAPRIIESGANVLVAATAIFGSESIPGAIEQLRHHA